jgi:hypothetical protein
MLVTSNNQGGRGKKGGLSEYAEKVGKHKTTIGEWIKAAEVFSELNCRDIPTVYQWHERAFHLTAIHKLPQPCHLEQPRLTRQERRVIGICREGGENEGLHIATN